MRESKTEILHIVQGCWSGRWEDECADTNRAMARSDLRMYRVNQPEVPHRLIRRRVWKDTGETYDSSKRRVN